MAVSNDFSVCFKIVLDQISKLSSCQTHFTGKGIFYAFYIVWNMIRYYFLHWICITYPKLTSVQVFDENLIALNDS